MVNLYLRKRNPFLYVKHFSINNVLASLGFVNSRRFLRYNQSCYTTLSDIVFPTWRQAEKKNKCLGYEIHPRQSPALNLVDFGFPATHWLRLWICCKILNSIFFGKVAWPFDFIKHNLIQNPAYKMISIIQINGGLSCFSETGK